MSLSKTHTCELWAGFLTRQRQAGGRGRGRLEAEAEAGIWGREEQAGDKETDKHTFISTLYLYYYMFY